MKTYLEPSEVVLMEEAAANLRDKLLVRLLFHLGCRISEAVALEVRDVDLANGTVTIQHLKSRIKFSCPQCGARLGRTQSFCPKCGLKVEEAVAREQEHRRVRTLPLDQGTLAILRDYIQRGGPVKRGNKHLIFAVNRHRGWQVVHECAERARLPKLVNPETGKMRGVSPHRLRDCFAIVAMKSDDSGDGLRHLQEHLGHSNFNTTAKYRKISGEEHRGWYDRLWTGNHPDETKPNQPDETENGTPPSAI